MSQKKRKWILYILMLLFLGASSLLIIDYYVGKVASKYLLNIDNSPQADAIIVFGALVRSDGTVSDMLADRLNVGYKLYKAGKAPKIIVSGDHGSTAYDEVNGMRKYLQDKGVPREDIFMDHAGFDTYDSLYRARDVFLVKKAILVSQEFHVTRALYIGKRLGMEVAGVTSDLHIYPGMKYYRFREIGARLKAFAQADILKPKPKYLGEAIPIWKNGELTDDGKS